ncbi:4Fe-4S dicluster domain-containing protein [Massilia horti]|uniref:4Fe-4S dicluster domain-containing protein n=1 Tax=Massilia horti TaxID=2562153 RepID=A0A4Y9T0H3_9BURK|nr:4Fe-4S dicluster domain-containing protein [Massilia horti]TFW32566.1 4Fe-4S dicluster domain-containing protein [Massilia horti]
MNIRFDEGQGSDPLQDQRDALARAAALDAAQALSDPEVLDSVSYRSQGNTLVAGFAADALPLADRLAQALPVTVLLLDGDVANVTRAYPVHTARAIALTGWLGAFEARWQASGQDAQEARFDLVLDLCPARLLASHQRPHGYFAPGASDTGRNAAVADMLEMVGEFEKPKYFAYKERLCAHSRNTRSGCNACIDICSAKAIQGAGEKIQVNPYLCAGCGACTTVCPSGALGYAYPPATHTGRRLKAALRAYLDAGGSDPVILFHDTGDGAALALQAQDAPQAIPGRVIPLPLYHTASTGIDVWLAALAYGARGITVLMTGTEAPQYAQALGQQMTIAQTVLAGLGYAGPHFQLLRASSPEELVVALRHAPRGQVPQQTATFNLAQDKRNTLDYALDHLHRHAPGQPQHVALPAGAPFGFVAIDKDKCSLCMACVGACPAGALQDGQGLPQLRFIEKNCVQCSLCVTTCPEHALALEPRMSFADTRNQAVVLNETRPFHCIRCDKPFGTLQMIENMLSRLSGHAAFADNLDRIRMCGDCRVVDMLQDQQEAKVTQLRRT